MLPPLRVPGCFSLDQYQFWFPHPGHLLPGVLPVDLHVSINFLQNILSFGTPFFSPSSPSCLHLLRLSSLASPGYHPAHSLLLSSSSLYPVGSFFVFIPSGLPCQLFLPRKTFSSTFVLASFIRSFSRRVGGGSSPFITLSFTIGGGGLNSFPFSHLVLLGTSARRWCFV
jgi:hypothetical protein